MNFSMNKTSVIKKMFVSVFMVLSVCSLAQTVTYQDLKDQLSAKELTGRKSGDEITAYVASDGKTYKVGSTITYGFPTNGKYYLYFMDVTGSWVEPFASDDKETSSQHAASREIAQRVENRAGGVATIKKIKCLPIDPFNRMTSGCKIYLILNRGGLACTNFEEAIAVGEVQVEMRPADAAIQELKKWKEKLDLQIISQEEYDAKKKELMQYMDL